MKEAPYYIDDLDKSIRDNSKELLRSLLNKWIPKLQSHDIRLSMESHISENFFIFYGEDEYIDFINSISGLYALLDVAHNHYDRYSNHYLVKKLNGRIGGFHISDAIQGDDFKRDIHRELGKGDIDFSFIDNLDKDNRIYFAFEIKRDRVALGRSINWFRENVYKDKYFI